MIHNGIYGLLFFSQHLLGFLQAAWSVACTPPKRCRPASLRRGCSASWAPAGRRTGSGGKCGGEGEVTVKNRDFYIEKLVKIRGFTHFFTIEKCDF